VRNHPEDPPEADQYQPDENLAETDRELRAYRFMTREPLPQIALKDLIVDLAHRHDPLSLAAAKLLYAQKVRIEELDKFVDQIDSLTRNLCRDIRR
jgi:hypothetical protein